MDISQTEELATIGDWVRWGASRFSETGLCFGHGTDNALDEALALTLHALHLDHQVPQDILGCNITAVEKQRVFELFQQRVEQRIPAAYLVHEANFAGLSFYINENVLVPRSPIAELVEQGFSPWLQEQRNPYILDLCTGSGCIGIATAHYLPQSDVDISDISPSALEVARVNVERHHMHDRVQVIRSDVFEEITADNQYDLIVSNPPYVSIEEMQDLPDEYEHEPSLGLEAGDDGMDIVARILCRAEDYLKPDGVLVLEVGASMNYLLNRYPAVPFLWIEFERGGDGVFVLTSEQLKQYRNIFIKECNQ